MKAEEIENPYWDEVKPFYGPAALGWPPGHLAVQTFPDPPSFGDRRLGDPWSATDKDWYRAEMDRLPKRPELVQKYSWAIPDPVALEMFMTAEYPGPMVEVGAGTGYWAWLIEQMGGDVVCYDSHPPGDTTGDPNEWHEGDRQWTPVLKADVTAVKMHPDRALFLCWPPYATPFAADALRMYEGNTVVYIGEGHGGCTGDGDFHEALEKGWEERSSINIAQWEGLHDRLEVWRRT